MEKRICLERIEDKEDFLYFAKLVFNEDVMNMNMGRVFTANEADGYFSYVLEYNRANENAGCYKVFSVDQRVFIGIGILWAREDGTEIEYMVLPEFWQQGYATEIVAMLIEIAKQNPIVHKISGMMDPENVPSQKVLIKNGFIFEKTFHVEEDDSVVEVYSLEI